MLKARYAFQARTPPGQGQTLYLWRGNKLPRHRSLFERCVFSLSSVRAGLPSQRLLTSEQLALHRLIQRAARQRLHHFPRVRLERDAHDQHQVHPGAYRLTLFDAPEFFAVFVLEHGFQGEGVLRRGRDDEERHASDDRRGHVELFVVVQGGVGVDVRVDLVGAHPREAVGLAKRIRHGLFPQRRRSAGCSVAWAAVDLAERGGTHERRGFLRRCVGGRRPGLHGRQFVLRVRHATCQQDGREDQAVFDQSFHVSLLEITVWPASR